MLGHNMPETHAQNAAALSILWMLKHLERQCFLHLFGQNDVCWRQSSACCSAEAGPTLPCQHEAKGRGHQGVAGPASPVPAILKTTPAMQCMYSYMYLTSTAGCVMVSTVGWHPPQVAYKHAHRPCRATAAGINHNTTGSCISCS